MSESVKTSLLLEHRAKVLHLPLYGFISTIFLKFFFALEACQIDIAFEVIPLFAVQYLLYLILKSQFYVFVTMEDKILFWNITCTPTFK